jgi:autotransporter-associated beta strand protein
VLTSDTEVTVAAATDTLRLSSGTSGPGMLSKEGAGTLIVTGPNTYSGNTAVDAGKLTFNVATGTPSVGSATTVTVAPGATLELAGSISALGSSTGPRANIVNDSTAGGVLISGQHQFVGDIDGAGQTTIAAGSDLTANHIIQSALVIESSSTSIATLTITAIDDSGAPLVANTSELLISSLQTDAAAIQLPFAANGDGEKDVSTIARFETINVNGPAVPEATALAQAMIVLSTFYIRVAYRRRHVKR